MRVLYVTENPFLRSTTSSLNAILRQLRPAGLEPVMLFTEEGPWQQELAADGIPCHLHRLRVPDKRKPLAGILDTASLSRLIVRERIDLIHCNEHQHYPAMRLAARLTGRPMIATLHWNLEPGYGRWAFRPPYMPAALQFLSRAQLEASRDAFPPELPPSRIKLLMSGLFIDDFLARGDDGRTLRAGWNPGPETVVLGTASAIKPRKHLEHFIQLVSRLRREGHDVVGIVAGGGRYTDDDYLAELKTLIAHEKLERHCLFIGNLDPVTPFYRAIDIAVNTAEMEILSMSMCEGMACEKPTIAFAVGGNPETVHDPWFVVPFGDVELLTDRARKLVTDAGFRSQAGAAAATYVRSHFDAPGLAARQRAIYEEALGRPLANRSRTASAEAR
jgi:glycosyltransferase involved in cell wall biosynthesis